MNLFISNQSKLVKSNQHFLDFIICCFVLLIIVYLHFYLQIIAVSVCHLKSVNIVFTHFCATIYFFSKVEPEQKHQRLTFNFK